MRNKMISFKATLFYFIQSRVYTGLTNIVKEAKAQKKLEKSSEKALGGKGYGQLKEKTKRKLADYYKKAILRNKGNVEVC